MAGGNVLVGDIVARLEVLARELGQPGLNRDEGLRFGEPDAPVQGIQVCWMATQDAIEAAAASGANLIVAHEDLFYPYDVLVKGGPADFLTWRTNARRARLLARHGIAVIRAHGTLDRSHIFEGFAQLLALPGAPGSGTGPLVDEAPYGRIYGIEPQTLRQLTAHVKVRTGMTALRVAGNPDAVVRRVGLPWGGMALFVNVGYMQRLVQLGADVFIAGESDNYGLRFAVEAGIPLIETSHEVSENPGLRAFTGELAHAFPHVPVAFHENPLCWRME
ncbi:MAG TPA: Nif3-like dinuclear metal center hexameric protein [Chloroflexota bacterium]|nr:Nif3-like dinuclear metal center hexameric protein [Chloroflexota bacterium]